MTTVTTTTTPEIIKELNNILFRFALIDTEQSYEKFLESYLDVIIEKLNYNDESIKKKVMEVLSNINKRSMVTSNVQFPITKLLSLYHDDSKSMMVKNFAIIYIEKGFKSLSSSSKVPFLQEITKDIHKLQQSHQDIFCHILLSIIISITIPKNEKERKELLEFLVNEKDKQIILSFFFDFLITPPVDQATKVVVGIPPCHSQLSLQRVMGKTLNKYDFNQLSERKMAILSVLSASVTSDTDVFIHFLVGSIDSIQEVQKKSEDTIKRLSKVSFENESLIDRMYSLFLGNASGKGNESIPMEQRRQESSPILKERILFYFCKSVLAANKFPMTLHVIFDSIYGASTTMKLKQSAMAFVQWVFRHSSDKQLSTMAPIIFSGLLKLIDELENSGATGNKEINELKSFTYMALGLLCKREKDLFKSDVSLVGVLMKKVTTEESMVASSIQDALLMIREAFIDPPVEIGNQLIDILMKFVYGYENSEYQIRTITLQWAQHCFSFDDVRSRYISLLFSGDSRPDIRDEAKRGLSEPYKHQGNMMVPDDSIEIGAKGYPDFQELLGYIIERRNELTNSKSTIKSKYNQGANQIGFSPLTYENMLILLRTCLRRSALQLRQLPSDYIKTTCSPMVVEKYLEFIQLGLECKIGDDVALVSATSLLELMNLDSNVIKSFASKLPLIDKLLKSSKPLFKDLYSKIVGLLSVHFNQEKLQEMVDSFMKTIEFDNDVIEVYGPISTMSSIIASHNLQGKSSNAISNETVKKYIETIFKRFIDHNNQSLKCCTIQSIGLVGLYCPIPVETEKMNEIITKLIQLVKSTASSERNISEISIQALGWICFGQPQSSNITEFDLSFKKKVIDSLFELVNNKNEEMQFTVGETLSLIIGGHKMKQSIYPFSPLTFEEIQSEKRQEDSVFNKDDNNNNDKDIEMKDGNDDQSTMDLESKIVISTFERILTNYFSDRQSPITRCSAGIWMVCLLKNFGKLSFVQSLLSSIQNGFISLLSDNNELTQDIASKGITLVYDSSVDPKFKEFLVSNLGKTLSGKPTQKAPGSSELLPEGSVGGGNKTGSVLTYKELSSVANDLGKPDMVYKLMNLSNHHQIWNSKKGASFAIVSLAGKAKDELAPLLPYLIPKIYRFVYDPNPKMAASMRSIMNALIDPKDVFPQYFQPIIKEVLQGMGTTSWRVREASCAAIPDTITHATPEEILPYLEEIFYMSFRTLDDIKESVRKASEASMKSVGNVSARLCDPNYTSTSKATQVLKLVLPFILNKGITNDSNDVKQFSIQQLVRIAKSSKELLVPYIPDMLTVLLESLSSLEPASFNYASFHAESLNVTQDQLESMRVEISKSSPLNDILEISQKYIDQSNITQVLANLIQLVQFSVGIITRVGIAKYIGALFQSKTAPVSDLPEATLIKLINTIFPSVIDRSPTIRKHFINALSFIINKCPNKIVKSTMDKLFALVSPDSDPLQLEDNLQIVGSVFRELYKNASSKLHPYQKDIIPFLYFYKSHPKKEISEIYKSIWDDNSIGSIKLYSDEIIKLISISMNSGTWSTKEQAALCLSSLTDDIRNMIDTHLPMVLSLIVQGLKGRTYPGKDSLLHSLSTLSTICKDTIRKNDFKQGDIPTSSEIVNIIFQECKKNDLEYKRKAITNLSIILKSFDDIDIYEKVIEEFYPMVFIDQQEDSSEPMSTGKEEIDKDELKLKPMKALIRTQIYNVIGDSFKAASNETKLKNIDVIDKLLSNLISSLWSEQQSILYALVCCIKSIWNLPNAQSFSTNQLYLDDQQVIKLFSTIAETLNYTKYLVVKKSCLDLLEEIVLSGSKYPIITSNFDKIKLLITESSKKDNSIGVQVDKLLLLLK